MKVNSIDIFCEIIDNFGDIGVVYRLSKDLKEYYPNIRIFLNRTEELTKINKKSKNIPYQKIDNIEYITFSYLEENNITPAPLIIEAFGCNIPTKYYEKAKTYSKLIINLEYLSAESWTLDFHLQKSPTGTNLEKVFFMPGFTENSGGLLIGIEYLKTIRNVKKDRDFYIKKYLPNYDGELIGTIFSYERDFNSLLKVLEKYEKKVILLVFGYQSQENFKNMKQKLDNIQIVMYDFLEQNEYEEVINMADFNFVRGEDSIVRAILSGKPFLWHIYLQEDYAHMDKLTSFLDIYLKNASSDMKKHLTKLFRDYNFRLENSYKKGVEDYTYFFNHLGEIEKYNQNFSDFLIKNVNLLDKLKKFIDN